VSARGRAWIVAATLLGSAIGAAVRAEPAPAVADAVVDLRTAEGAALVGAQWRYRDADIVEIPYRAAGPDRKASGPPNRTHDLVPRAGVAGFDDSGWDVVAPEDLERRRSTGRLSAGWYRLRFTIPDKIGRVETAGAAIWFEIVVDDYAEIWVDGRLPLVLGSAGGAVPAGWNAPNRVRLTERAEPGRVVEIAVLAINGPLSYAPANFVWIRSATLDVYRAGRPDETRRAVPVTIDRRDPALDAVVSANASAERLADNFVFTEGPVWVPDGYLLFSDPNANVIYRWSDAGGTAVFRTKSGYSGADIGEYGQPGSNGLALDPQGRLTIAEHGRRRVTRLEPNGTITVLADRYRGKRLNSPNDLVYRSDGTLYFTDPPFGLPRFHDDERRELPFSGIYRLRDGELTLENGELSGPNGIAFSPDERHLYVTNWDTGRKVILRFEVAPDGALSAGTTFFDMTAAPGEEALDGLKVDRRGNLFASGPGGVWVISPEGKHLGTLTFPQLPANLAWGDTEGRTLYLTARSALYRLRLR